MNHATPPSLPTLSDTPEGSRLTYELRRFIDVVLRAGLFLTRNNPATIIVPATGTVEALSWDVVNRVALAASAAVQLPRIAPRYVGVPLYLMKLNATGTLDLRPTGLGLDKRTASLINGAAVASVGNAALYMLMHDGTHWYMGT
jgi:hypothetical protein